VGRVVVVVPGDRMRPVLEPPPRRVVALGVVGGAAARVGMVAQGGHGAVDPGDQPSRGLTGAAPLDVTRGDGDRGGRRRPGGASAWPPRDPAKGEVEKSKMPPSSPTMR